MIYKKNLWFLTLFTLVLVLSVYYVTLPSDMLLEANLNQSEEEITITESNIIETLKIEENASKLDTINTYKETITNESSTIEDKNNAFDAIKLINQISSKEDLLEELVKLNYSLDSFIKIEDNNIKVVVNESNHDKSLANKIMKTIQDNYNDKAYISISFK